MAGSLGDTFNNGYAWANFNHGEYAGKLSPALALSKGMLNERDPLMIAPDVNVDGGMYYYKTALALNILRNVVLEPDRFDYAFKTYVGLWALITIENLREMALPVSAMITEQNGQSHTIKLPVEIWQNGPKWVFKYNATSKIVKVVLDPDNQLPDTDRGIIVFR